jgi:hypothetical protein
MSKLFYTNTAVGNVFNTLASDLEKGSGLLLERIVGKLYRKYTVTGQYILHPPDEIIFKYADYTLVILISFGWAYHAVSLFHTRARLAR